MSTRSNRLNAIKTIISNEEINSQEDLLQALGKNGFELTQATLSRDLKQLKVAKTANAEGKYVYTLPDDMLYKRNSHLSATELLMTKGFVSLSFSGNLAVIRTKPGYASSIAYDIDIRKCPYILGTIAGDDTILMVLREQTSYEDINRFFSEMTSHIYR